MKRIALAAAIAALICASPCLFADKPDTNAAPTHPATQEWVLTQLAKVSKTTLQESDWAAVCQTGSMTSAGGCYGNVSTQAYQTVDAGIGGFTDFANIGIANVSNSVFIKKYLGTDGNPPGSGRYINVSVHGAIGKCEIFTESGQEVDYEGVANFDSNGNNDSEAPEGTLYQIANGSSENLYGSIASVSSAPLVRTGRGIYLICVGINSFTNPVAAGFTSVTATWS